METSTIEWLNTHPRVKLTEPMEKGRFEQEYKAEFVEQPSEVVKITESQSRYGIMEELNTRKIAEKEKLTVLEAKKEQKETELKENIANGKLEISSNQATYKSQHKERVRRKQLDLDMLKSKYNRDSKKIIEQIEEMEDTYEEEFKTWKEEVENQIKTSEKELSSSSKTKEREIVAKKEIISEIDKGMENLKQISKEQKKD